MTARAFLLSLTLSNFVLGVCVAQPGTPPTLPPPPVEVIDQEVDRTIKVESDPEVPGKPVMHAEESPVFPGGDLGLAKELKRHLKYPAEVLEIGLEGKVFVQYVVGVDGSIGDIKVVRGVHPLMDKAAVDAVKHLPNYSSPAKMNGKPVPFQLVLPVVFQAQ